MSTKPLDSIVISTADPCEYSVIWLHGLGASGHDFEPIVPELNLLDRPGVRFLFPHAPVRPITVNGGAAMRGWYDITSMDFGERQQDTAGIRESVALVNALIDAEIDSGISPANILLAGFSQGGAIALFTALTTPHKIGGVMALSTYLPIQDALTTELTEHGRTLPVFMAHGQFDEVIHIRHAEQSLAALAALGVTAEWHSYSMAHSVSSEEVADIATWLKLQFGM